MSEPLPYRSSPRRGIARFLPAAYLLGGVLAGLGLAAVFMQRQTPTPDSHPFAISSPAPSEPAKEPKTDPEQTGAQPEQPGADGEKATAAPQAGVPQGPATGTSPGIAAPSQPPAMQGNIPNGAIGVGVVPPVNPIVIGGEDGPPAPRVGFKEIMVIVPEADVAPTTQRLRGMIQSHGGAVLLDFTHELDYPERGIDLFGGVPKAQSAKLFEEIVRIGSAQETDDWTGPQSERHNRMQRFFRDSVQKLDLKHKQLLAKYFEDAPEVVRTQEALVRHRKAQSSLRPVAADREGFRIFIGKAPPSILIP